MQYLIERSYSFPYFKHLSIPSAMDKGVLDG